MKNDSLYQSDQGLHCPLTKLLDNVNIHTEGCPRADRGLVQAILILRCLHVIMIHFLLLGLFFFQPLRHQVIHLYTSNQTRYSTAASARIVVQ